MTSPDPYASTAPASPAAGSGPPADIRVRAVVLGLVLAMVIGALTPYNNVYKQATPLGGGHFPLAPFFILIWLVALSALAHRVFKDRILLTGRELLVTWILMVLVSGMAYTGLARTFFINLTAPLHLATVENRWAEVLQPLLPDLLYPRDGRAVAELYNGIDGGRQMGWGEILRRVPWHQWMTPLMVWGGFILLCYLVMMCMVNLLSRQALHNERMNFPLLQVPQMLADALDRQRLGQFLGNRFLLAGLSVPVLLHLLNGLHFYLPQVPQFPTLVLVGSYFSKTGLFSGFLKLKIYLYPAFIGFAFLAAKQVSFSFWFFYIAGALLIGLLSVLGYNIPAAALGVTFGPTLARPEETQMIGAYGVFFFFLAWLARHHFLDIVRISTGWAGRYPAGPDRTAIRWSFWGLVTGITLLVIWLSWFGLSVGAAILVLGVFFMVMLVATRVICQGGIAYFTLTAAPVDGLLVFLGPKFFTSAGLLVTAVAQKVLFVDLRESLMPSLFHARKLTDGVGRRPLVVTGILLALVGGVAVSFVAMLALCYRFGTRELGLDWATRTTVAVYDNIYTLMESPVQSGQWVWIFALLGAAIMLVLVLCYHRFYWWPIHPIGYLTAYSSAMRILWFSFFMGWACNALCMRYGGVTLFKKLRFFFVGLVIGDFLMGGAWALVGLFADGSYQVLPV